MKLTTVLVLAMATTISATPRGGRGGFFGGRKGGFGGFGGAGKNNAGGAAASSSAVASSAASTSTSTADPNSADLQLNPANVQTGSESTGQNATSEPGQAESATDTANFINFCTGKTITNGAQVKSGSCNGIVMGDIPSTDHMVSSMIISPQPGEDLLHNVTFDIKVQTANLQAGSFTNAANTYYAAPQAVGSSDNIIGHTHVTVQYLGDNLTPTVAPNAANFSFFKGINDDGNGQGLLTATVEGGLAPGFYRVCTMSSASNHQPVLMPVAQRGAQDDCTKFSIGQTPNGNNPNGGGNSAGQDAGAGANLAQQGIAGSGTATSDAGSAAATTAAPDSGNNNNGNNNNDGAQTSTSGQQQQQSSATSTSSSSQATTVNADGSKTVTTGSSEEDQQGGQTSQSGEQSVTTKNGGGRFSSSSSSGGSSSFEESSSSSSSTTD